MPEIKAVFLDLSMPGIPGMDVMNEIRRKYPSVKILISSGLYRSNYSDLNDSNTRFISKPFKSTELLQIIKELISTE
jgi:DNA-binding NtrC family response regulator